MKTILVNFWQNAKFFRIFAKSLSLVAILGVLAWFVLSAFIAGRENAAPLLYHEMRSFGTLHHYKGRIKFDALEFLLRSKTITHIDIVDISWDLDASNFKDIKSENRYISFTSEDLLDANTQNLGVLTYKISFKPLIKTILLSYIVLMLGVLVLLLIFKRAKGVFFTLLGLYLFAALALATFPLPFAFIAFGVMLVCLIFAFKTKNSRLKLALIYFSVLPSCLAIAEIWLFAKSASKNEMTKPHEILGYANTPFYNETQEMIVDDKLIARYTYTHDEFGNRIVPNSNENSKKCIAIYGGSFAYGSGVDNSQTLENFLAKELPEFRVINLGIGGTGANTALARLEFGLDSQVLSTCEDLIAIYEAIPHHIYRAYGVFLGPRYKQDDNKVRYWGTYKDGEYDQQRFYHTAEDFLNQKRNLAKNLAQKAQNLGEFAKFERNFKDALKFKNALEKSYLKRLVFTKKNSHKSQDLLKWWSVGFASNLNIYKMDENDTKLYFSIVSQMDKELKTQYNAPLNIVLWDFDMHAQFFDKYDEKMKREFKRLGVNFWALSEIIDDYTQDLERVKSGDLEHFKYRVSRWDTHPNALANEKIAKFLATKIKSGEIKINKKN